MIYDVFDKRSLLIIVFTRIQIVDIYYSDAIIILIYNLYQ